MLANTLIIFSFEGSKFNSVKISGNISHKLVNFEEFCIDANGYKYFQVFTISGDSSIIYT